MNKKVILSLLFLFLILNFAGFLNAELKQCGPGDDGCKTDNGYSCLEDKIDSRTCGRLGDEEKVFSLITAGKCKSEVTSDSKYKTDIKYTALAVLGGAKDAESWLVSKNRTTDNLDWFLQIDTTDPAGSTCDVSYGSPVKLYTVSVNEDKTLSSTGLSGSCFSMSSGNYWLKVDSNCFNEEIKISCDKSYLTSLIYQRQGSSVIYVSDETHSSSGGIGAETKEKVQSLCFGSGSACSYEGSLWASLVLNFLNHDISSYLPYLVANVDAGDNEAFLPEAFLYSITGGFGNELLGKQKADKWWQEGSNNNKFYDTSLALYAFHSDDYSQKQNSIRWLFDEAQGTDGCWNNGNIRDTAFVLYALEPKTSFGEAIDETVSCTSAGFFCMSPISCSDSGGSALSSYTCPGTFVCCNKEKTFGICSEQGGSLCASNQECVGGTVVGASDAGAGTCCLGGVCEILSEPQLSACEIAEGECRFGSCLSGESELSAACVYSNDKCCVQKSSAISSIWIWVLLILITLAVFGIIFRDKLRHLWFRLKSKFTKGGTSTTIHRPGPPGFPHIRRIIPRSIMPSRPTHTSYAHPKARQTGGELKDVLRKLKEMGK